VRWIHADHCIPYGVQLVGGEKVGVCLWVCFFIYALFCFPSDSDLCATIQCAKRVQHFLLPRIPRNGFPGSDPIPPNAKDASQTLGSKSHAPRYVCMYVQYKNQNFVDRRESVVANVPIGELLCEQRPAEKDSKGREITTQKVNIHSYRAQRGPKETYNMAASPTCLTCLPQSALAVFCASGNRSNGCGSIVRTSARAREKMERARRWVTMRMIGEMGAIFCAESPFFLVVQKGGMEIYVGRGVEWF